MRRVVAPAVLALGLLSHGRASSQVVSIEHATEPSAVPATDVEEARDLASPVAPPPDPHAGRRYAPRAAARTLTLAEGVARVDHVGDWTVGYFRGEAPNQVTVGVLNDLELGVSWPWTRDPTVLATARVFGSEHLDVGVRGSVMIPVVTTGTSVVHAAVPIVIRPTRDVRLYTALDLDLLLTPQVSPYAVIPLQILGNATRRFFLGLQGAVGWLDMRVWTGQVGFFVGHTVSATEGHPIFEVRITTSYMIELVTQFHVAATLSIFPRLW